MPPTPQKQTDITQPPSEERLRVLLANDCKDVVQDYIERFKLPYKIGDDGQLQDALFGTELWLKKFITVDPDTILLKDDITKLSKCDDEVLIIGETGTGKELLARALIGNRQVDNTRIKSLAINCAGLPEGLVESELFGHEKGSFTGAMSSKQGMMAEAKDGLLFLDEIGELPISVQGKLLRAIQDRKIRRVGSNSEEDITCKFAFATNRDLARMVKEDKFRQDLYARISTFELHVKPLRSRKCDIEPIVSSMHGGKDFYHKHGLKLHDGTLSLEHNVRSLQQHVKRWTILGRV